MQKHVPAGYDAAGKPMTAVETAMLLGISKFAEKNGVYFSKIKRGKILLITGIIFLLFSSVMIALSFPGVLTIMAGLQQLITAKTTPVRFPGIIVLEHSTTSFENRPILVSTLPSSSSNFIMNSYFPDYPPHTPNLLDTESELYIEPGNDPRLSVNSIHQFHGELQSYNTALQNTGKEEILLKFLTNQQANALDAVIFELEDPGWMYNDYITNSSSNDFQLISESRAQLDHFINLVQQNNTKKTHFLKNYEADFNGYSTWYAELEHLADSGTNRVLESVYSTYAHIDDASKEASGLLLESVDHRIKENERKLEFEAKQKMDELESKLNEMQESIQERKEELKRSISSQSEIVKQLLVKENHALASLQSTPNEIELQLPYTEVSGGGGSVGPQGGSIRPVSSYVRYETVRFTNPEYAAKEQTHNMISTLAGIENQKLKTLEKEHSSADQLVVQRRFAIEKEQEDKKRKYRDRMEAERKELSRHSLKVQALHQDILENPLQIDIDDVYRLVKRTWQQPSKILATHLDRFQESFDNAINFYDTFEQTSGRIASTILAGSPSKINLGDALYTHWVCKQDSVIEVLQVNSAVSLETPNQVETIPTARTNLFQIPSDSAFYGSMFNNLNPNTLPVAASSLHQRGCIESAFFLKLKKLVEKDISKVMVVV